MNTKHTSGNSGNLLFITVVATVVAAVVATVVAPFTAAPELKTGVTGVTSVTGVTGVTVRYTVRNNNAPLLLPLLLCNNGNK